MHGLPLHSALIALGLFLGMLVGLACWACCVAGKREDAWEHEPHGDWTRITPEMRAAEAEYLAGRDGGA